MSIRSFAIVASLVAAVTIVHAQPAAAATAAELTRDAQAAPNSLYAKNPGAKAIGQNAVQSGSMVGIGIQGNKITKIKK